MGEIHSVMINKKGKNLGQLNYLRQIILSECCADGPTYRLLNDMKRQRNIVNRFVDLEARVVHRPSVYRYRG